MSLRAQFNKSIKCGTGEAYFILRDNPHVDFSNSIIQAALHNFGSDPQLEGDRAFYTCQLINLSAKRELIIEAVLRALNTERKNRWDLDQLFEIAASFAKEGNIRARNAMYKRYSKNNIYQDSDWCGEDAILSLDGIQGLMRIAEVSGKAFLKNPEMWEDDTRVSMFQSDNPQIDALKELKLAAKKNPHIKKYVSVILKNKYDRSKIDKTYGHDHNYDAVKQKIDGLATVPIRPGATRFLSESDISKLADDFSTECNALKKEKFLRVFSSTKYPNNYQPILKIAMGKNIKGTHLIEFACRALQFFKGKDIRDLALKGLQRPRIFWKYLPLLVSNYKKGDAKLLSVIARRLSNSDQADHLAIWYVDIFTKNRTKECLEPLEILYRKITCGPHRLSLVEILHENNVLSPTIKKEIEFDSYEYTREYYNKNFGRKIRDYL